MCEAQNQILEVFWWFDDKGKGVITRNELARVLKSLSPDWNDQQVDRLVNLANPNSDGLIKYREFISWLMGGDARRGAEQPELAAKAQQLTEVEAKQLEAQALADQIARDSELAERASAEANELLEAALPALDAATAALDCLEEEALAELAAAAEPLPCVAAVAACLCALQPLGSKAVEALGAGAKAIDWAAGRDLLLAPGLRAALREYNKDAVEAEQVTLVCQLLNARGDLMSDAAVQAMAATSSAGHALLLWVLAVVRYFESARNALPKFELVNTLHQDMWRAEASLSRVNQEVEALMA